MPAFIAGNTGFGLSQRMQSFVLDPAQNPYNVLAPGKRPRATLSPSMALKDGKGNRLDGGSTYRLHVPASVPVHQYWSATAYDGTTHALIRDTQWSSRASTSPGMMTNDDASVDVYFGPAAPDGLSANWVPTKACNSFEVLFRFYGP